VDSDEVVEELFRVVRKAVADFAYEKEWDIRTDRPDRSVTVEVDRYSYNRYLSGVDQVRVKVEIL
jgi:hypothetical protein